MSSDVTAPRVREVGAARGAAQLAGVLLHGRGKTPEEKIDLAARFGDLPGVRWLVPVAETPGSWYPGRYWDPRESNEPFLSEAVERCHEAVEEASERGRLGPKRIVLVGFSQGACLSIEYALRHPGRVASIIVYTGAMMGPPGSDWKAWAPRLDGLRVLLTGSDADDWVPQESTRETERVLTELGADVHCRIYHGRPHIVSEDEIADGRAFLDALRSSR
ncbi:MAG TPA: alpha/beta fold hydrolase [Bryobacteraceae bacterium]|nr:alpha/beta fold hydrolase [Bryobacteraceae bacterium]